MTSAGCGPGALGRNKYPISWVPPSPLRKWTVSTSCAGSPCAAHENATASGSSHRKARQRVGVPMVVPRKNTLIACCAITRHASADGGAADRRQRLFETRGARKLQDFPFVSGRERRDNTRLFGVHQVADAIVSIRHFKMARAINRQRREQCRRGIHELAGIAKIRVENFLQADYIRPGCNHDAVFPWLGCKAVDAAAAHLVKLPPVENIACFLLRDRVFQHEHRSLHLRSAGLNRDKRRSAAARVARTTIFNREGRLEVLPSGGGAG